ncbi:MAG: 23S rRNA (uracil(1939)-C(5))-methyltransferase RlmD [Firmicutes bacterium]|nr:23S rRNA (uracil(1939)-C(5))-methyltransferase RlmD [Bacillota bacterium]
MLKKNEIIELDIYDLHNDGHGIGKTTDGLVIFVENALPQDTVKARILKVKKKYAYAKVVKIINASPDRMPVADICPLYLRCGGCQLQHLKYPAQLKFKEKLLRDALIRIGGCENPNILPIVAAENPHEYRNKAQFPIGSEGIGLYAPRSHRIVTVKECNIQKKVCINIINKIWDLLAQNPISIYNEETHTGLLRHIAVRIGENTGEVMIIFVINGKKLPTIKNIAAAFPDYTIVVNQNLAKTNVIFGENFTEGYIHDKIGDVVYRISPGAFFQVNTPQTEHLYNIIVQHLQNDNRILDVYSGIGGIALYVAKKLPNISQITAVENSQQATEDAKHNAELNNITTAEFLCGNAETMVAELLENNNYDTIILDPPRKGCNSAVLDAIVNANIAKIIYVSCDPATLARDVKYLATNGGYKLVSASPVDMFPMTGHVETVCLIVKN